MIYSNKSFRITLEHTINLERFAFPQCRVTGGVSYQRSARFPTKTCIIITIAGVLSVVKHLIYATQTVAEGDKYNSPG